MQPATRILIGLGLTLIAAGLIWQFAARILLLGRLPGDVVIERGPVRVYFPIVTCLIISVVLSIAFWLWRLWRSIAFRARGVKLCHREQLGLARSPHSA